MLDLSDHQKRHLAKNPNVLKITARQVTYTAEFKAKALELYQSGTRAEDIFENHGIPPSFFVPKYCIYSLKRWRHKIERDGKESLKASARGLGATGRRRSDLSKLNVKELRAIIEVQKRFIEAIKKKRALAKKR